MLLIIYSCENTNPKPVRIQNKYIDTSAVVAHATEIRSEPNVGFEDFPVEEVFKGKKHSLDYQSNKTARKFKTVITEWYIKSEIEFGGYYSVVTWGCGTACQAIALVDWRDGKVYEGPTASMSFQVKKDSRMMLLNPPDSDGFYPDCGYCKPEIWIWDEDKKVLEQLNPKL